MHVWLLNVFFFVLIFGVLHCSIIILCLPPCRTGLHPCHERPVVHWRHMDACRGGRERTHWERTPDMFPRTAGTGRFWDWHAGPYCGQKRWWANSLLAHHWVGHWSIEVNCKERAFLLCVRLFVSLGVFEKQMKDPSATSTSHLTTSHLPLLSVSVEKCLFVCVGVYVCVYVIAFVTVKWPSCNF